MGKEPQHYNRQKYVHSVYKQPGVYKVALPPPPPWGEWNEAVGKAKVNALSRQAMTSFLLFITFETKPQLKRKSKKS